MTRYYQRSKFAPICNFPIAINITFGHIEKNRISVTLKQPKYSQIHLKKQYFKDKYGLYYKINKVRRDSAINHWYKNQTYPPKFYEKYSVVKVSF